MFIEAVTPDQLAYAQRLIAYHNFGQRGIGDGNEAEQLTGMIGQTVFADMIGAQRPNGEGRFDGGVDFCINGKRVDVKTMTRTTGVKDYYVHNFIGYQKEYEVDYYVFLSYNKKTGGLTVCGCIDKPSFFEKASFFKKGEKRYRSDGSYFFSKAPLYEINQTDLVQVENLDELLASIH